jgi:hypothetical protein
MDVDFKFKSQRNLRGTFQDTRMQFQTRRMGDGINCNAFTISDPSRGGLAGAGLRD